MTFRVFAVLCALPLGAQMRPGIFRISPVRPVEELRAESIALRPPAEKGPFRRANLVDVAKLDRRIKLDIRYATGDNFLSTPVYSSDGQVIGRVDAILDNYKERIFDGLLIETPGRELRFVDAPEVARTAERGVTLTMSAEEARALPPPEKAGPTFRPNAHAGRLGRLLGRGWKRQ